MSSTLGREELRLKLRRAVLGDTYLFCKVIMGYADIDIDPHYSMCEFLDWQEEKRRLLLAPRGTIKSYCTRGWALQQLMKDPNIRILYVMSSEEVAKSASRQIDQIFRNNRMLRWLFPDRIPNFNSATWGMLHRQIPREKDYAEPSMTFCGIGTGQTGLHYDIIICDDVIEEEAAQSETVMKNSIAWFSNCEPLLDELNPAAQVLVVGTRWLAVDLYSVIMGAQKQNCQEKVFRAEGNSAYMVMKRRAMENGKPYWARKFSEEKLAIKKAALESQGMLDRYYLWYQNDPIVEENCEFPRHMIRKWNWSPNGRLMMLASAEGTVVVNPKTLRYTMAVDPAFEKGSQFDESAISIIGSHPRGYRILFYGWTGQVGVTLLRQKIVGLCVHFHEGGTPIAKLAIEKIAGQRTLIPFVKEELHRRGCYVPFKEDIKRQAKGSKDNFIRGFINVVAGGWYYTHDQFLGPNEEMDTFPNGRKNFLDTLAYQLQLWTAPEYEEYFDEDGEYDDEQEDDPMDGPDARRTSGYGG